MSELQARASQAARKVPRRGSRERGASSVLDRTGIAGAYELQSLRGNEPDEQRHTERRKQRGNERRPQQWQQQICVAEIKHGRAVHGHD
jgi:hypothetical protein